MVEEQEIGIFGSGIDDSHFQKLKKQFETLFFLDATNRRINS